MSVSSRFTDVVVDELRRNRFYHLAQPLSQEEFDATVDELGHVIRREDVRLHISKRLVHRPEALRFHTDQPQVDILAWRCRVADANGPTLLLDAVELLRKLDSETLKLLEKVTVMAPNPDNLAEVTPETLLRLDDDGYVKLFYIAFRGSSEMTGEVREAWERFVSFVETEGPRHAFGITLKEGECLFLHNRSYFHARPALSPDTPRWLERIWISSSLVKGIRFTEKLPPIY